MWLRHHAAVPFAVVDVGSNTVRLLVADGGKALLTLRETLCLGEFVERDGVIPPAKLAEAAADVRRFVDAAAEAGALGIEVLITSPGRLAANGGELLEAVAAATSAPVRILTSQEEGRLAFVGATRALHVPPRRRTAVVDVGGGSTQLVIGSGREGIIWSGTIDLGSRRLTSRVLRRNPPSRSDLADARTEVDALLAELDPPAARSAVAVGGSARALKRLAGVQLGGQELENALNVIACTPAAELVEHYDVNPARAETLAAGATILAAVQAKLGLPLKVVRAGLREGAVHELGAERRAA
jgi:exopolyphosphatase/guanosine-5'-triphosphate,3'-diphosphate pyrophosphatase